LACQGVANALIGINGKLGIRVKKQQDVSLRLRGAMIHLIAAPSGADLTSVHQALSLLYRRVNAAAIDDDDLMPFRPIALQPL
jgi:hypothetical protein